MDPAALRNELSAQGFSCIETHISRVYLRGAHVFKTKRPLDMGFLDFRTLADRKHACEAELTLNRRLAADVYLELCALVRGPGGELSFVPYDGSEAREVLEFAVHMRRLRDETRADQRLLRGELTRDEIAAVARLLADFHAHARSDAEIARFGEPDAIGANVEENFRQVHAYVHDHLSADELASVERYQREFLVANATLFRQRAAAGCVRDGHGDLRLEHVYRNDDGSQVIIDCIEFNERFRFADICADLAFLSMDLRSHNRGDLAELLLATYAEVSGDYGLYALLDFYESYRAFVRAKVASFLAHDPQVQPEAREQAWRAARRHFLLALAASRPALVRPRLIVCMGMIASGKSTLAEALAERLGVSALSADRLRKALLSQPALAPLPDAPFAGGYAPELSEHVYTLLRERARALLGSGRSVIVDAGFRKRRERDRLRELAAEMGVEVLFLECRCGRACALARLAQRAQGPHVSDGRAEIYDALAADNEPPEELQAAQHMVLDSEQPLALTLERVARAL
jgi:uncharacterized protein